MLFMLFLQKSKEIKTLKIKFVVRKLDESSEVRENT